MKTQPTGSEMTMNIKSYSVIVSLDVHNSNIYMYVVNIKTGLILADCNLPGSNLAVVNHLRKIRVSHKKTIIIYEAGSAGFSPYRYFTKEGFICRIIAPTSIPIEVKRQKTDRYDAIKNLDYCVSGLLRYVHVHTEEEENNRELTRYRADIVHQLSKQKQKILAFVTRTGLVYNLTKSNWTKKHLHWLRTVELSKQCRYLLNSMLMNLDHLDEQIISIDKELDFIVEHNSIYTSTVAMLQIIAGIGRVSAITLALEIVDFSRFPHPNALMSYTGLIPGKHSSGTSNPSLSITKAGNKYLRLIYVGAAKSYRDRRLLRNNAFIKKQSEPIREFLQRMQNRLYSRYRHLCATGKPSNKAKCAVARELCGFTWELFVKIVPQLNSELKVLS